MTRLWSPPPSPPPPPIMTQLCSLLGVSPSSTGSQMLQQAKQEVPSLELGPPSPSWMDQLVGSPTGVLKPAAHHAPPERLSLRYETTWMELTTEPSVSCNETPVAQETSSRRVQETSPRRARETSANRAGTICESRKRSKSPSKKPAKRRRVVAAGVESPPIAWFASSADLTAETDALSEALLAPSAMDMERDATEEFMNEFWGDLLLDTSPISNDNLIAAAQSFDEPPAAPLPAAMLPLTTQPDCHLIDDVTADQLMELTAYLEPELAEPEPAPVLTELPQLPGPVPAPAEVPAAAPIDLAALLEETEIVFSAAPEQPTPELAPVAAPSPSPASSSVTSLLTSPAASPPPAASPSPPAPAAPTHYLLVLSAPKAEPVATPAPSVAREVREEEAVDDPVPVRRRAPRRPPATTPAEKYRRIRDNNNEASRRSRQQRRQRETNTEERAAELEAENSGLRERVAVLEGLLEQVRALAPLLTAKR